MRPTGRWLSLAAIAALSLSACTSVDRPTVQADEVPLPTPMRSFGTSVAGAIESLDAALAAVGERLEVPTGAYRPSEPESLLQVPRAVRRVELADLDDGFVVVYEAGRASEAERLADDLAAYLGSGFGQTNYVADTQFSVSVLDATVVFTTWSPRRSDDPDRAQVAFDALAAVGNPVEVRK